jgi:hypothetical protein
MKSKLLAYLKAKYSDISTTGVSKMKKKKQIYKAVVIGSISSIVTECEQALIESKRFLAVTFEEALPSFNRDSYDVIITVSHRPGEELFRTLLTTSAKGLHAGPPVICIFRNPDHSQDQLLNFFGASISIPLGMVQPKLGALALELTEQSKTDLASADQALMTLNKAMEKESIDSIEEAITTLLFIDDRYSYLLPCIALWLKNIDRKSAGIDLMRRSIESMPNHMEFYCGLARLFIDEEKAHIIHLLIDNTQKVNESIFPFLFLRQVEAADETEFTTADEAFKKYFGLEHLEFFFDQYIATSSYVSISEDITHQIMTMIKSINDNEVRMSFAKVFIMKGLELPEYHESGYEHSDKLVQKNSDLMSADQSELQAQTLSLYSREDLYSNPESGDFELEIDETLLTS